ncbi:MAG: hypothetical protein R3Y43_00305 [Alphaproteobacteria bacterium]
MGNNETQNKGFALNREKVDFSKIDVSQMKYYPSGAECETPKGRIATRKFINTAKKTIQSIGEYVKPILMKGVEVGARVAVETLMKGNVR